MKKLLAFILSFAVLLAYFSGCSSAKTPENSIESSQELSQNSNSETAPERYDDENFPKGTPEEQEIIEKYLEPHAVTGLFLKKFSKEDMSEIDANLLSLMFITLSMQNGDEAQIAGMREGIPKEYFENFLATYFNLSPEQIYEKCTSIYNEETKTYSMADGIGGGPSRFIITDYSKEGEMLTFSYEWYGPAEIEAGEDFYYELRHKVTMSVREGEESFMFISNSISELLSYSYGWEESSKS